MHPATDIFNLWGWCSGPKGIDRIVNRSVVLSEVYYLGYDGEDYLAHTRAPQS